MVKKNDLVLVEWGDAWSDSRWVDPSQVEVQHKPIKVKSTGFIARYDSEGLTLTQGFSESNDLKGMFFIPRGMIQKIKKIKI